VGYRAPVGDYLVDAYDFVTTVDDVAAAAPGGGGVDELILSRAHAEAWVVIVTITGSNATVALEPVPAVVKDRGGLSAAAGDYNSIKIGVVATAPYTGDPIAEVTGTVIDRDVISNTPEVDDNGTPNDQSDDVILTPPDGNDRDTGNPSDASRYIVAADNAMIRLSEVAGFVGLDSLAKTRLIGRAYAEAFKIAADPAAAAIEPWDVDVTVNDIPAGAKVGDSFYVTFIVKGVPSVYAKAKFTVSEGNAPVLEVGGPLVLSVTSTDRYLYGDDLMVGVTARDAEDGDLSPLVKITEPGTNHLPTINTVVPGIYQVDYAVADNDGNNTVAHRAVVVNDGRYDLIDEDGDSSIDLIVGAKNFVVKQVNCNTTVAQAKSLSYVEAYDAKGVNLTAQVDLVGGSLPPGYLARQLGVYSLVWTVGNHSAVAKAVTGEIAANDSVVTPIDKASLYAVVARPFTVNTPTAAGITDAPHFISATDARVIKLVNAAVGRDVVFVGNGGFKAASGVYPISFRADGIDASQLSVVVNGTVTNGSAPTLSLYEPIIIRVAPAGSPDIDAARIIRDGHIVAIDSGAVDPASPTGNVTDYVQLIDTATNQYPFIPADQPGVYQVKVSILDGDGNLVEQKVAVVVDDGNFVYGAGFILRAHDFIVDLRDVEADEVVEQIREQSSLQAWRNDGVQVNAAVVNTGGYRDEVGTYSPVVGIYDSNPAIPPILIGGATLSKPIAARVIDTYTRYRVTFNANGGTLIGPRVITVVEPQTALPYLPASPIRDGYTFRHWATSPAGGSQFTADIQLAGDLTLYAIWAAIPIAPTPAPTPAPIIINNPPAAGGVTYVTVEPDTETEPATIDEDETPMASNPSTEIEEAQTPTASPATSGWSLFNLLATILSLLLLMAFFIKFFFDRPREEEYEEEPIDAQLWEAMSPDQRAQYQARREADYQSWLVEQQKRETRHKAMFVNAPVLLIVGLALVEALILLFTTQNFTSTMSIVDNYSVPFSFVLFVQLLTPMVAAAIRNSRRSDDQQAPGQPATTGGSLTL
jgi:uncharacterized repeat protein (TIGR02543 family)